MTSHELRIKRLDLAMELLITTSDAVENDRVMAELSEVEELIRLDRLAQRR